MTSKSSAFVAGSYFFSRTEAFTEEEQKAIDQKGFLWPDYCVCMRPDLIQTPLVCQRQADLVDDPAQGP